MNIAVEALLAPTIYTLDEWLNTPRLARCGGLFTPSAPMWRPDPSMNYGVNWQAALACFRPDMQKWAQAALAYYMAERSGGTVATVANTFSRAVQSGIDPLNEDHLIDLRERFNPSDFGSVASFLAFWSKCESLEQRPSKSLIEAYKTLPRKKKSSRDVVLSLDPEEGPFTQTEQDALYQWINEQFAHGHLSCEYYLYMRLLMIYGQRGVQMRMMVFSDFIKSDQGYKVKIHWAKQKENDVGWRAKSETFSLDEDLYKTIQAYKAIILVQLWQTYPDGVDWDAAIENVPLFRRRLLKDDWERLKNPPVLVESPLQKELENAPHPFFHINASSLKAWYTRIHGLPGLPISTRTHQRLIVSKGHRFRHTVGTDLSNAGLGEFAIASALLHKGTETVRKYRQVSAELMALIDEKMSDHMALVVSAFTGVIVTDRISAVNGDIADKQIEDLAVCGANSVCHLDAPYTCYACSKFQPFLHADHRSVLERLERRREQTLAIDKTTGVLWDRAILACRKVIIDCDALIRSDGKSE